jgi:hypothetical protein
MDDPAADVPRLEGTHPLPHRDCQPIIRLALRAEFADKL